MVDTRCRCLTFGIRGNGCHDGSNFLSDISANWQGGGINKITKLQQMKVQNYTIIKLL